MAIAVRLHASDGWTLNVPVSGLPLTFGRAPGNEIEIPDGNVSRQHCRLEFRDGNICITDLNSANGTVIGDRLLTRGESLPLVGDAFLVLGSVIVRVLMQGIPANSLAPSPPGPDTPEQGHAIVLVDVCDSTELPQAHVEIAVRWMRDCFAGMAAPTEILLLKNLGDGFLAIFSEPERAVRVARRLLDLQRLQDPQWAIDLRVTIDFGATFRSSTGDRIGLAINRASRFEKTQRGDLDEPGTGLEGLRVRNRCLASDDLVAVVSSTEWSFVGRRKLRGFGDRLFGIHQLD